MSYYFDPQIGAAVTAAMASFGDMARPERGDWKRLRDNSNMMMAAMARQAPDFPEVSKVPHRVKAEDGAEIALRWYKRGNETPGSAVLYMHGGGMICGSIDLYDPVVSAYVAASGVPMLAVDYRLAPEHPHPIPVEDSYAALRWLVENAAALGVDTGRIAVMGDSAGGCLTAGVALLARERGLSLARQILIYPMLDDRNLTPDPALAPFAIWSHDDNFSGWSALLGSKLGTADVPPFAAPSRAEDLAGLAPAYMEVGELDIFRDEDIDYARRLAAAQVSVELHVHPGAPHGFERIAPDSDVARRSMSDRVRVLGSL